jgi:hypothetical protein
MAKRRIDPSEYLAFLMAGTPHEVMAVFVDQKAANAAANTWYYSSPVPVDGYIELLLIATQVTANAGAAANFQMKLQVSDLITGTDANSWIDLDSGITVPSPGNAQGPIAFVKYTNFGAQVRSAIQWGTGWTNATNIITTIQAKS